MNIKISPQWGIVIRRDAIEHAKLTMKQVLEILEVKKPLSENKTLVSFGPHFGEEAADTLMKRLEKNGLTYIDDFFVFFVDLPDWVELEAKLKST